MKQNGYSTAAWGKWHNTPDWETTPMGPFNHWPTGEGFEYCYGFHGGETSQWEPQLFRNTMTVEPPKRPEQGYHLTEDIVDDAIAWINREKSIAPGQAVLHLFRPRRGACAAARAEGMDRQVQGPVRPGLGQGEGRDVRAPEGARRHAGRHAARRRGPKEIEAWDSLSPDAKKLYARQMEVYAGFLAHADYHIGRLIDAIEALPDTTTR